MRHNYRRTVRSLWTWLWGRYHVPQNVFLVCSSILPTLLSLTYWTNFTDLMIIIRTHIAHHTVSCTFITYHTWQFIIFTIFTITACIFSYSLSISFWTQDLALQQSLSSIDLFLPTGLITRTLGPSNDFTLLNGWIGQCIRLSRLLVGFRMHFKSLSFIHSSINILIIISILYTLVTYSKFAAD